MRPVDRHPDARTGSRRERLRVRSIQMLPTLITATNLLAGLLAISYLLDAMAAPTAAEAEGFIVRAAWLIFLGMLCDGLDGRIARMTGTTSAFGAQLDSLADVVTFGTTPALVARCALGFSFTAISGKVLVGLAVLYLSGAALRLARYNVESERVEDDSEHVTHTFRGLPSPAAAGVIASLILLRHEYGIASLDWVLLFVTPLLGLLMVSRLPYSHVLNKYFDGSRPLVTVLAFVTLIFLALSWIVETVAGCFLLYAMSGPIQAGISRLLGHPEWAFSEEDDENRPEPPALETRIVGNGETEAR